MKAKEDKRIAVALEALMGKSLSVGDEWKCSITVKEHVVDVTVRVRAKEKKDRRVEN